MVLGLVVMSYGSSTGGHVKVSVLVIYKGSFAGSYVV